MFRVLCFKDDMDFETKVLQRSFLVFEISPKFNLLGNDHIERFVVSSVR